MRGAAGLVALTAGAILTFAVSAQVPGISLRITGVIIMLAGLVALITPARAAEWARWPPWSRGRLRGDHGANDYAYPEYLLQDPAVLAAEVLRGAGAGLGPGSDGQGAGPGGQGPGPERPGPGAARQDGHNGRV